MSIYDPLPRTLCVISLGFIGRIAPTTRAFAAAPLISLLMFLTQASAQIQQRNFSNRVLQHGINIEGWFNDWQPHTHQQYENYISGIPAQLQEHGVTYIRIFVNMGVFTSDSDGDINVTQVQELVNDLRQVENLGIGVLITPVPQFGVPANQDIKTNAGQYFLNNFWHQFGIYLSILNPKLTFPEPINEPVLPSMAAFDAFQQKIVSTIRAVMPTNTIIATGNNWSGIDGILDPNFQLLADANVIYAVHFYEPFLLDTTDITTWESWAVTSSGQKCTFSTPIADDKAVSIAPFPVSDVNACHALAISAPDVCVQNQIDWYCNTSKINTNPENTAALLRQRVHKIGVWARRNGVIVADTEFGIPMPHLRSVRLAWIAAASDAFKEEGIGYALWAYGDSYGFAVSPSPSFTVPRTSAPALDQNALCVFQALKYAPTSATSQSLNCTSQ